MDPKVIAVAIGSTFLFLCGFHESCVSLNQLITYNGALKILVVFHRYKSVLLKELPNILGETSSEQQDDHIYDTISIKCATKSNEEMYENVDHLARKDESPIPPKVNQSESSDHNIDTSSNSAYGVTLGINEAPMYESVTM